MKRVADTIAASLLAHGTDRAFIVPGESFLALLDALVDLPAIDLVTCRHEGSAALAAVADAKLTGRPGVVMVSRGPGLANAMIGHPSGRPSNLRGRVALSRKSSQNLPTQRTTGYAISHATR